MADIMPHNFFYMMGLGKIDWDSHTIKYALVDDGYTPNVDDDTWETGSSPFDDELTEQYDYTAGGYTLTCTVTDDDSNNWAKFDCSNPTWTANGGAIGPFRYGVIYVDSVRSPQNKPIAYVRDYTANQTANDGATITDTISGDGLFTIA